MKKVLGLFLLLFTSKCGFGQVSFQYYNYSNPNNVWVNHSGIGDFNGDGRNDVVTTGQYPLDSSSEYFFIFLQNSSGLLDSVPIQVRYSHPMPNPLFGVPGSMIVADMNGDGLADIVISTRTGIYIYIQTSGHSLVLDTIPAYASSYVNAMKIADIDGDGYMDIVVSTDSTINSISVLYGTPTQDSFSILNYPCPSSLFYDMNVGYTARNARPSILRLCGDQTQPLFEIQINPNRSLKDTVTYSSQINGWPYSMVASGDWYGNGYHEIAASYGGNQPTSAIVVWNYPDSVLTTNDSVFVLDIPQGIIMADLNCSGSNQIIVGHGGWNWVSVLSPTSNQTFAAQIPNNMYNDDMTVGDVSGDGRQDIVVSNTYAGVTVLVNTGTFTVYMDTGTTQISSAIYDTVYTTLPPDTITIPTLLYINGDTQYYRDTEMVIHHYENATIENSVNALTVTNQCTGDSVHLIDTVNTVIKPTYTNDSVVINIYYDTVLANGIGNIGNPPNGVRIFPNPFVNGINITGLQPNSEVELYDDAGSFIFSEQCGTDCFLERGNISPGVYLLKIRDGENVYTVKVSTQ